MNILIIGNGFDLAHGFPTRYKNFLNFINEVKEYCEKFKFPKVPISDEDKKDKDYFDFLIELDINDNFKYIEEVYELSCDNHWFKYFNHIFNENSYYLGDTWIDFENEISRAISHITSNNIDKKAITKKNSSFEVNERLFYFVRAIDRTDILDEDNIKGICFNKYVELKKILLKDLNALIRSLEIYLCIYVNNIKPNKRITEFNNINSIDAVLTFNYTNTYERLYGNDNPNTKYHYIHGKANKNNTVDSCQLVLGINEYSDTTDDNNTEFIQYEKFFQRIYKRNGCEYTKWIENESEEYKIYIYGHSLDSTDADVLNEFIKLTNCTITIFYYDDEALENQIKHLVEIIGKKKMIGLTSGSSPKIIFKRQDNALELNIRTSKNSLSTLGEQMNLLKDSFKRLNDTFTDRLEPYNSIGENFKNQFELINKVYNNPAIQRAREIANSPTINMVNKQLQLIDSLNNNPAVKHAREIANSPAIKHARALTEEFGKVSDNITQAAHNDYLYEPGEKENIQSDLDKMDSWDNEE